MLCKALRPWNRLHAHGQHGMRALPACNPLLARAEPASLLAAASSCCSSSSTLCCSSRASCLQSMRLQRLALRPPAATRTHWARQLQSTTSMPKLSKAIQTLVQHVLPFLQWPNRSPGSPAHTCLQLQHACHVCATRLGSLHALCSQDAQLGIRLPGCSLPLWLGSSSPEPAALPDLPLQKCFPAARNAAAAWRGSPAPRTGSPAALRVHLAAASVAQVDALSALGSRVARPASLHPASASPSNAA